MAAGETLSLQFDLVRTSAGRDGGPGTVLLMLVLIVIEKTRDIGILKSLGASATGIMGIFLSYGLSLGVVGAGAGLVLGLLINSAKTTYDTQHDEIRQIGDRIKKGQISANVFAGGEEEEDKPYEEDSQKISSKGPTAGTRR